MGKTLTVEGRAGLEKEIRDDRYIWTYRHAEIPMRTVLRAKVHDFTSNYIRTPGTSTVDCHLTFNLVEWRARCVLVSKQDERVSE